MKRQNSQKLGDVLREFFEDNKELHDRILETRLKRAWGETLGTMVMQYTRNLYIKDRVLYVSLTSSVLRNELSLYGDRLVESLNQAAGGDVIYKIVIR